MSFCPDDVIARGRRAVLRRKRLADAVDEYGWRSDPELARYDATSPVRLPRADYLRHWAFDYRFTDMPRRSFAIEDERGRHIGNVMYYNVDRGQGEAELGISIGDREHWGQGYGADAVAALVRYVFRATDMQRLYLHTLDWNTRARRCFERAGFQVCGTSWRDGYRFLVMEVRRSWLPGRSMAQKPGLTRVVGEFA